MQITVKHTFQSTKPDSADATLVQPSNWNADHNVVAIPDVSSVFGRTGDVIAASGDYNVAQITNAVSILGNYPDPPWITSLAWAKITGAPATGVSSVFGRTGSVTAQNGDYTAAQVTNAVSTAGSYADPPWLTSLNWSKVVSPPAFIVDPLTTKGDLLVRSATANARLPVGADGLILMTDSSLALGVKWVAAGAGFQTPWLTNINAANFDLFSVGKIGIGNATPSSKLSFGATAPNISSRIALFENPSSANFRGIGMVNPTAGIFGVGIFADVTPSDTNMMLFVKDGGNVGIGVVNPQSKLQIGEAAAVGFPTHRGNLILSEYSSTLNANMGIEFHTRGDGGGFGWRLSSLANDADLVFESRSSSPSWVERMRILNNGNVGIGTANPLASIHLARGDGNYELKLEAIGAAKTYGFAVTGAGSLTIDDATVGSSRMLITAAGNVGIGTASPAVRLDVQGGRSRFSAASETFGIGVSYSDVTLPFFLGADANGDLLLSNSGGNERMRITAGGNVGIGTASPTVRLDVFDIDERRFSVNTYSGFHTAIGLHGPNGANIDLGFFAPTTIWQIRGTAANFTIYDADASHGVTLAQNASAWAATSDERGKNITGEITNALHKVCSLRGVEFNQIGDTLPRVGLVAQDVQKVLPEAIDESNPDKLGIRYTEVIPLLVEAIKELERRTV